MARLTAEHGIAMPVAILLLMVIALLGGVVATQALTATGQSKRDRNVKRAVAGADAGMSTAIYRLNNLSPSALLCVVVGATGLALEPVQADGWCRAQTEELGDGSSYSYRMSAGLNATVNGQVLLQRKVLATGTAAGVNRRALATVASSTGQSLFGGNAITSLTGLSLGNSTVVQGHVASNGDVSLSGSTSLCGHATYGTGKLFTTTSPSLQCNGYGSFETSAPIVLNPVDQGNAPTQNNNSRIGVQDPFVPSIPSIWNPATRVLQLKQFSALTLTGDVYSFCNLQLENSAQLIIGPRLPSRPPLKIFIDAPENCPGVTNAGSVKLLQTASILNANANPETVRFYLVGSSQTATSIEFLNSFASAVNMLIYAPRSTAKFQNSTTILGAVAAKSVLMENSAQIIWHDAANATIDDLLPLYRRQSWVECTGEPKAAAPDSGCS